MSSVCGVPTHKILLESFPNSTNLQFDISVFGGDIISRYNELRGYIFNISKIEEITARVLADNTRRCYCANACKQFSYAHQLWRKIEIEDQKNLDEDTTPTEQQQANPDIDDGDKPIPKEHKDALIEELKEKCKKDPNLKSKVITLLQDITPEYAKDNDPLISKFLTQRKHYIAIQELFKKGGVKT